MMTYAKYLGDGVYVDFDEYHRIVLTTNNHQLEKADDVIYMEPEIYSALVEWMNMVQQELDNGNRT